MSTTGFAPVVADGVYVGGGVLLIILLVVVLLLMFGRR